MTEINHNFDYEVIRSNRRTLSIEVHHQKVKVRAPQGAPNDWIEGFVYQKAKWIARKLVEQAQRDESRLKLQDGEVISFMGQVRHLTIKEGVNRIQLTDDKLQISNKDLSYESLKKQLDRWLLAQAKERLPQRVETMAGTMGLARKLSGVRFRKTKTQWGHCTAKGIVQLNQLILLTPTHIIDYLIVHELCHLKHLNHSKRFWKLVEKHCPDYQQAEVWLKQYGHSVWF
ncbi:M48 family metallopeptidase [Kangiella shandongensis]|uniref:M48 family metallopeptidase n=1 Tax=Kangiella shandongensis TaxID=2763258 RepID=UPI001CBB7050|nr:SprT family zinc-dependent metalloprotease [Kangiella shandongensis]